MRRIIVILTIPAVIVTLIATSGASVGAQSPCPPTGPSDGPATLVNALEPVGGAGFVCVDEQAQEFFCPPEYQLQLFPVLPGETSGTGFIAECVEQSSPKDSSGTGSSDGGGGAELTQNGEQQSEAGDLNQTTNVS